MKAAVRAFLDVRVPMRDGVELATHVYLPPGEGPFPVIFSRTPYDAGKAPDFDWPARGFASVRQDVRGKFRSGGEWYPWFNERNDGEDSLGWIASQPWCDGSIAMYGGSYVSATQLAAAASGHPALKCVTPCLIGCDFHRASYWGGAFRLAWQTRWTLAPTLVSDQEQIRAHLPLADMDVFTGGREIPFWRESLAHPTNDAYWQGCAVNRRMSSFYAPAFIRTGWFDHFVGDVFDLFNGLKSRAATEMARQHSRILVGPWPHDINQTLVGDENFGREGKVEDLFEQEVSFLRHFTTGEGGYDLESAPIRLFVMGANRWRDEYEWPLARTVWTSMYLRSEGRANTSGGDGTLGGTPAGEPDCFDYDPENPVPTLGGAWDFFNVGPQDQTEIEQREDVLIYSSEELTEDLEVIGPVSVILFASSSAPDTDFTAKLVDVRPDGKPMSVTDGIARARFRQGGEGTLLSPGEIYEFVIECNPTAYLFKAGHRVRLEISSSNFPAFARNHNTGNDPATDMELQVASQTVFHSLEYPSRLVLPVIKEAPSK